MAFFDLRIKRNIMIKKLYKLHFIGTFLICVPASNGVCGIKRDCNIRNVNSICADAFLRGDYSSLIIPLIIPLIIHEEHIVNLPEYRIQFHLFGAAYSCIELVNYTRIFVLKLSSILRIGPSKELASRFFRCGRRINCFAIFDFLGRTRNLISFCIMKNIRSDRRCLILIRSCDDINRELACLKGRSLCRSVCDLACVAAVIDVQDLMALAAHISGCGHVDRNRAGRLNLLAVLVLESNVNRDGIDDFLVLADRILHAVIIKNAGHGNRCQMHGRAFRESAFICMNGYLDA